MAVPVWTLDLRHSFYQDGRMRSVKLVPDGDTHTLMNRYSLIGRQSPGSYRMYYLGNGSVADVLNSAQTMTNVRFLTFYLTTDRVEFTILSDLPLDWRGSLIYHEQQSDTSSSDPTRLQLTLNDQPLPTPKAAGLVQVPLEMLSGASSLPVHRSITMAARTTEWRYYLFNRSQIQWSDPSVTDLNGLTFKDEGHTDIHGEQARIFSSGPKQLPLAETLPSPLKLVDNKSTPYRQGARRNQRVLVTALPLPNTDPFSIRQINGEPYACSEIFVYV